MTTVLLDTNVLVRYVEKGAAEYASIRRDLATRVLRGDVLCVTPQVLIEFWVVVTRPLAVNGFGWDAATAGSAVRGFLTTFRLLPDDPEVLGRWLTLVSTLGVRGKRAHDLRLVAVMAVHGVSHILTMNTADFENVDGVVAVAPVRLATS